MLCHRCYLGADFWVNVFTFHYIGMVISISVLSFYSDGYDFSFHVVDILQSFGLAIVTVVDPSSTHFFPLWISCSLFFISGKFYFSFVSNPFAHIKIPKTKEK